MKKIMLAVACLVLVGGFMLGCKKKTEVLDKVDDAASTVEKDASKVADDAKKALDDL